MPRKTTEDLARDEQIRQAEVDRMRKDEALRREQDAAARADVAEGAQHPGAGGVNPGAREARSARPSGMQPETFPNKPGGGYRPNPANQKTEMPPERQAPPAPEANVGQGRVKPHEQPTDK